MSVKLFFASVIEGGKWSSPSLLVHVWSFLSGSSCFSSWRSILPLKDLLRGDGAHHLTASGHSICAIPSRGGAAMEGKHNTNRAIVRGWGRWDNAGRKDEKNDSPFSIVVISKDEPTAPAWEGMGLHCSQMLFFPALPSIISGEKGWRGGCLAAETD